MVERYIDNVAVIGSIPIWLNRFIVQWLVPQSSKLLVGVRFPLSLSLPYSVFLTLFSSPHLSLRTRLIGKARYFDWRECRFEPYVRNSLLYALPLWVGG